MKATIRKRALELGFDDCRFTAANPPAHAAQFQRWLAEKQHGEMIWLERNAEKRVQPQRVLAGARSVISLAVSYGAKGDVRPHPNPLPSDGRGRARDDILSSAEKSAYEVQEFLNQSGVVARYARFDDYHDVLAGRLKELTVFINQQAEGARSLWYVDTGPLLERDLAERAGLGFAGKHTNLISRKLGNWIFLSEIITTLELEPDAPEKNHCGSCARCKGVASSRTGIWHTGGYGRPVSRIERIPRRILDR